MVRWPRRGDFRASHETESCAGNLMERGGKIKAIKRRRRRAAKDRRGQMGVEQRHNPISAQPQKWTELRTGRELKKEVHLVTSQQHQQYNVYNKWTQPLW